MTGRRGVALGREGSFRTGGEWQKLQRNKGCLTPLFPAIQGMWEENPATEVGSGTTTVLSEEAGIKKKEKGTLGFRKCKALLRTVSGRGPFLRAK